MNNPQTALPKAIIFDWDNTLAENWGAVTEAMNAARRDAGMEEWSRETVLKNATFSARDIFPVWFGGNSDNALKLFYATFARAHVEHLNPMPDAGSLLSLLSQRGVPMLILSNKRGDLLREEVAALGWNKYFLAVVGSTDAPKDKPSREAVDFALAKAGLSFSPDIWFVGDTEVDVNAARKSGCVEVLLHNLPEAERLKVSLSFSGCREMADLLQSMDAR